MKNLISNQKKNEMMLEMLAIISTGEMPSNLNLIPPEYKVYNLRNDLFMTVFLMEQLLESEVSSEISKPDVAESIKEAHEAVLKISRTQKAKNAMVCYPIELDKCGNNFIGIIVTNRRIFS